MNLVDRIKRYGRNVEKMKDAYGYNEGVRNAWTPIWVRNAGRNYSVIDEIFAERNADIALLQNIIKPKPTIILGSGPSQHDIRPYLKDWKGNLFISTSQIPLCAKLGIEPTVIMLIDCDPAMTYLVADYVKDFKETILVTHPQIPREYLDVWPKDRIYFFRMLDPGDKFANEYLPLMYGWLNEKTNWAIRSTILNGGNIVNTMIPMSASLGAKPIFLAGYDLGYPDGLRRCSDFKRLPDGTWEEIPAPPLTEERWKQAVKIESNNGIPFDELGLFYKTSSIILLGMANPPVIQCSRGCMNEWNYADPKEVVEKQGEGFDHLLLDPVTAYKASQAYLRPRGFLNLKTDYWVSVNNIGAMRGLKKWWTFIAHAWYSSRPWKWSGGKGWVPLKIKMAQAKQRKAKKAEEKNVQGQ